MPWHKQPNKGPTHVQVKHYIEPEDATPTKLNANEWERIPEDDPRAIECHQEAVDSRLDALEGQMVDLYKRLGFQQKSNIRVNRKRPFDMEVIPHAPQGMKNVIYHKTKMKHAIFRMRLKSG